ncbi:leucine rich repeat containing protein BspA family protein, partial [Entamoeba invadens IP1]
MQIIAKYLLTPTDYLSIIQICKKYEFILDRFRINPIRISPDSKRLFQNIQTQIVYTPYDIIMTVDRHIFLYFVSYTEFIEKNTNFEVYKNVRYTSEDVEKHGNKIPEVVSTLDCAVFDEKDELIEISIPSNVTEIDKLAFESCGLTKIEIPSTVKMIRERAFTFCSSLKEVKLPENITMILNSCFDACSELENVNFPNSLQFIGSFAFSNAKLVDVTIPEFCDIGADCFSSNGYLTRIVLNGVSHIPNSMCELCYNLKIVEISDKLIEIGNLAFKYCGSLEYFNFNDNLEFIGNYAFNYWTNLKTANLKKK